LHSSQNFPNIFVCQSITTTEAVLLKLSNRMSISKRWLSPSSSLPKLRSLGSVTESQLKTSLENLHTIYCPLRLPAHLVTPKGVISATADSGYASEDELAEENSRDNEDGLRALRLDAFERSFAVRWLTSLLSRAEELPFEENVLSTIIDEASLILSYFSDTGCEKGDDVLIRDFSFPVSSSSVSAGTINIRLKDAPLSGTDHTDAGLQSWGAGIHFSGLLCVQPERFGLACLPSDASLVELGAGTGLISLTLAKLLPLLSCINPTLVATDYHSAVLDNLRANIDIGSPSMTADPIPVKVAVLDWSAPPASLKSSVHMLFAADVVYASEHAALLRDCAAHLLAADGLFWLVVTVRSSGKFKALLDTTEAVFEENNCPRSADGRVLRILEKEMLQKKRGVGREDERGYMLFKIGWVSA
jgi:hypothetical protein